MKVFVAMIFLSDTLSAFCRWRRTTVSCLLFIFVTGGIAFAASGGESTSSPASEIQLVWSADYGKGEQVFFSRYTGDDWTIPVQISASSKFVFKPVSAVGDDGKIWVIWTESGKKGNTLQFSVYRNSNWSRPQPIETGLNDNRAVTVIVDKSGRPWLAWTGAKKSYSDVFWSRWNGTAWDTPVMAHAANNVPDVHPELSINDSGRLFLSWQTYTEGKYRTIMQEWDGRQWRTLQSDARKKSAMKRAQVQMNIPPLPECIKEPWKATLFMKTQEGAGSFSLSGLSENSPRS